MYQFRREPIVATDVGGTKILTVVIDADGKILASDYRPTVALRPFDEVIEDILDAITKVTIQSKIEPLIAIPLAWLWREFPILPPECCTDRPIYRAGVTSR